MDSTVKFFIPAFLTLVLISLTVRAEHNSKTVHGSEVITVSEGGDVILPCSLSTKESVEQKLFVWKDGQKKNVFIYDAGLHHGNGLPGQDDQFRGRVSHFPEQMRFGNASIMIINTTTIDTGDYTCYFPELNGGLTFNITLVVGSVPKPIVTMSKVTDSGVQLKCEVQGAFPKPELRWQNCDGNIFDAEEAEISERDGRYHITLQTTVTSTTTTCFQCVVQQKDLNHETGSTITVPEKPFVDPCGKVTIEGLMTGIVVGAGLLVLVLVLLVFFKFITVRRVRGTQKTDGDNETNEPLKSEHVTV
ncbi:butyrophilin subfamily 2 member A1-like isoform X2 [Mugil cephalus]|uniref:butyrophilin subfamily 2 member A1-like isoform X2 n=1 Tax=Mugil cephalus TaxID=48193 RepID=UPI001FB70426|nr:butyrophilin subfamily 2 member A1-like isoform X2 [Mugil cephalus]